MDDSFSGPEPSPPYLGGTQSAGISERMQALMARAEQEVAEQHQLQALVGEVRQSLAQLQDEIRQAAGAHTLELVRGEVTSLGAEVRGSSTMIGERLEAVVRAVGAGAQVMQGVGEQLDRVTELLNHQQQQIAALSTAIERHGETLTEPAARMSGDVAALRERLDGVVGEVRAESASSLRTLAERIDSAVLALAEALLRPRATAPEAATAAAPAPAAPEPVVDATPDAGGADAAEDVPTTATMTVPVVAVEPEPEQADDEPEPAAEPAQDADADADEDEGDDTPPWVGAGDTAADEEAESASGAEPESEPAPPVAESPEAGSPEVGSEAESREPEPDAEPETAPVTEATNDAFEPAHAEHTSWDWDEVREHEAGAEEGDSAGKRRPWWRPGG